MIVDSSIILSWLFEDKYGEECAILRRRFENDEIILRTPSLVKYDVCKAIAVDRRVPQSVIHKFIKLVLEYIDHISIEPKREQLSKATILSEKLKIELSIATCIVLSNFLGELYVTADDSVLSLKKLGYPVIHVKEIV